MVKQEYNSNRTGSEFEIEWNDRGLVKALNDLVDDGELALRQFLVSYIKQHQMPIVESTLKRKAGPLWNRVVPPHPFMPSSRVSKNIYKRVWESMMVDDDGHTVRAGSAPLDEGGVKGSRGGYLAAIVASGMRAFKYPDNLPGYVRSSVKNFVNTGDNWGLSYPLKKKGTHPGFKGNKRFDYVAWMVKDIKVNFREEAKQFTKRYAVLKGFMAEGAY